MSDKNKELRDRFKYKKFILSVDNSVIYFDLFRVFKDEKLLGEYLVKDSFGEFKMTFNPLHLGPFENIWVITDKGEKLLINPKWDKLMHRQTITLTQVPEEQIPDDIAKKLDQLLYPNEEQE